MIEKARDVIGSHRESITMAAAAGVRIAMGTDSGVGPHGSNLRELQLMREVGMTPTEVLRATTSRAAELLCVSDELGTLEAGKRADLVVVDGDPLDFIGLRERVDQVWKDGRLVVRR
jgi:imidazolonepropionase-like amidohydrolase